MCKLQASKHKVYTLIVQLVWYLLPSFQDLHSSTLLQGKREEGREGEREKPRYVAAIG